MCHPVMSYDFFGNKTWVVLSVPRKYITSLRRLRRIGCRGETRLKKFSAKVLNGVTLSSIETISTGHISKVREIRRLVKGVLNPVFPEDPDVTLTSPPEIHLLVPHSLIQTLSLLSFIFSLAIGRTWLVIEIVVIGLWQILCSVMNINGQRFGDEHQLEHATNMYLSLLDSTERVNELIHRTQWQYGLALLEHWLKTPDFLYVIASAFNLCVVLIAQLGSTTVLPLYSYSDCPGGTLVIGLLTEQQHFIQFYCHLHFSPCLTQLQMHDECLIPPLHVQWIYHRSKRVSNWADSYYEKIADWNAKSARNRN
ncbi:hypothetical protein M9H77_28512 [Catharanthus roseus]|uniref:Uncharacterized protein n=1 Tax=Catharanthus roseus TaxID=4058 RepID=A0ACC0AGI1_CATRO|nr:hypothetical protein M9H77_28512 [Catharanthus roseus]